jgi:hypothetical protein
MKILLNSLIFILINCSTAWAYLDPGSASIWLQAIAAGLAGIASTYRLWLYKIISFFKKKREKKKIEDKDTVKK